MIILWFNSDHTWTLSHRTAESTVMPTLVGAPNADDPSSDASGQVKVVAGLSSKSADESPTVVTLERPLVLKDGYDGKEATLEKALNQVSGGSRRRLRQRRSTKRRFLHARTALTRFLATALYLCCRPGKPWRCSARYRSQAACAGLDGRNVNLASSFSWRDPLRMAHFACSYLDLSAEFTADSTAIEAPITPVKGSSGASSSKGEQTVTGAVTGAEATGTQTANDASGTVAEDGGTAASGNPTARTTGQASTGGTGGALAPSSTASGTASSSSGLAYADLIKYHGICGAATWCVQCEVIASSPKD